MIEKILESLEEALKNERKTFNDEFSKGVLLGYAEARKIVQEVAKEYEDSNKEICPKCEYELRSVRDFPCCMCSRIYTDHFTPKKAPYQKGE